MAKTLVPIADGVEEMEAVIIVDTLRRAGWEVSSAGVEAQIVTASRGVRLVPDVAWEIVKPETFDILVIPGGLDGTRRLCETTSVLDAVRCFRADAKVIAAICAGPLVLQAAGILGGVRVTCHPSVASELTATPRHDHRVVIDQNVITSQAPGTAFEFALAIIDHVDGADALTTLVPPLVLP